MRWVRPALLLLAWATCGAVCAQRLTHAWAEFATDTRQDGNSGYVQIDFAGQWVMGRLFADDGRRLYDRGRQRELVSAHFPAADADALMEWFVGVGDGVGGPLYPPVHGLVFAPLARLGPLPAYRVVHCVSVGLAVFAGLAISRATAGLVWWPVATVGVLLFPGVRGGLDLGQNHLFSLAVLAGGWWAMTRGRWAVGGAVWGLLAVKPVWAVAFLLVPVVMGRWRAVAAMCGVGGGLILVTLPVVGVHGWLNWLAVGREASATYAVNENWIGFSRDLFGLPRRVWVDFSVPEAVRGSALAAGLGWALWGLVVGGTVLLYSRQPERRPAGLPAAFLLLGAYLGCYRFMYYDAALAALPVAVLVADPAGRRWLPLGLLAFLYLYENWLLEYRLELTLSADAASGRFATAAAGRRLFTVGGTYRYAVDTAGLLAVWGWCGAMLLGCRVGTAHHGGSWWAVPTLWPTRQTCANSPS